MLSNTLPLCAHDCCMLTLFVLYLHISDAASAPPAEELLLLNDLFDFDCNLTHADLIQDVGATMQRGAAVGVTEMLVPGATLEESRAAVELCRKYPNVRHSTCQSRAV